MYVSPEGPYELHVHLGTWSCAGRRRGATILTWHWWRKPGADVVKLLTLQRKRGKIHPFKKKKMSKKRGIKFAFPGCISPKLEGKPVLLSFKTSIIFSSLLTYVLLNIFSQNRPVSPTVKICRSRSLPLSQGSQGLGGMPWQPGASPLTARCCWFQRAWSPWGICGLRPKWHRPRHSPNSGRTTPRSTLS